MPGSSLAAPPPASATAPSAADPALLYAPHGRPGRFWNPWGSFPNRLVDVVRWKLSGNPYDRSAPLRVPVVANDGAYLQGCGEPPSLTWVGHASFAIQDGDDVVLTDPHWGPRALVPRRLTPPGVPLAAVPPHAFAVVSHNHYDHLDAWTLARLPATVRLYLPWGVGRWFRRRFGAAAARERVVELDWWESARHGRWTVTCLPAQHWANRMSERRNASLWASWLLDSGTRRYYFAGDTGYFHGFAELGRRFAPLDTALLPIGAYEPRWFMRYQHMDPAEAYRAFCDLGARFMVAMHWGVFDLTDEPPDLPPRVLAAAVAAAGGDPQRVQVPAIGERWFLPD